VTCAACGFANEPDDEFCGGCGQRLARPAAADARATETHRSPVAAADSRATETRRPPGAPEAGDGERRQLTVMFCDLVGSTALAGRLDPEELREHVRAYQAAGAEVIERFEGHVAQYLGDGLLVYFGYPLAHEDDAQRAVRAALAIVDAVGRLNTRTAAAGVHLAVRIGIHTGLVVVGEIGGGTRREQLALGEAPNVAARLEAVAEPNTVVVSAATRRLVERFFTFRDLGTRSLHGVAIPQAIYQVLGESGPVGGTSAIVAASATPLVGRDREIALVLERWEATAEGMGAVVLLSGEAGIGKTRIVQTVSERLQRTRHTRLEGHCSPYRQHSPMHIVVELLQAALGFARDETAEILTRRLERAVAEAGLPPAEGVPLLASLLALPIQEDSAVLSWAPQRQRQRTIEIVLDLLRGAATRSPLLILLEDLHWIDASSLELLALLADQVPASPICLLLTARPEFRPPWAGRSHTTQVTLNRLPRRQTEELVLRVTGNKPLPAEVLQHVVAGADGVPLFVEEITKTVLESGVLRDRADGYELAGPLRSLAIPATLNDSLMARLDRLPEAKPVAQLAAAIGREFTYELLAAVSPLPAPDLQRELGRLVDAELLYQRGLPPASQYIFKHALIQEAAYQSLLRSTRQQYHRRIVDVLGERFPQVGELAPELVAHHYTEAGLPAEAIPYWQRAGESAVRRSAHSEAVAHFERGLALVDALPRSPGTARIELGLLNALGPVLFGTRGFAAPETERVYTRAQALCAELGDTPETFPALWGQWGFFSLQGNFDRSLELGQLMLARAQRSDDTAQRLQAHHALWATHYFLGQGLRAIEHTEAGFALYDPVQHPSLAFTYGGHDARVCGLAFDASARFVLGFPRLAVERARQSIEAAHALNHPHSLANAQAWTSVILRLAGDLEAALDAAESCQRVAAEFGFPQWGALATVVRGSTVAASGRIEDGLAEMRQGVAEWRATRAGGYVPTLLTFIAEAELARGDVDAALRAIEEALADVAARGQRVFEAELHRLQGEAFLARRPSDTAEAEACFHRALDVARVQEARTWELRAALSLARLWRRRGREHDARRLVEETSAWFTEGHDVADLRSARELIAELR
jgi:predicted ATPase/class 3 adenylate cyclase